MTYNAMNCSNTFVQASKAILLLLINGKSILLNNKNSEFIHVLVKSTVELIETRKLHIETLPTVIEAITRLVVCSESNYNIASNVIVVISNTCIRELGLSCEQVVINNDIAQLNRIQLLMNSISSIIRFCHSCKTGKIQHSSLFTIINYTNPMSDFVLHCSSAIHIRL